RKHARRRTGCGIARAMSTPALMVGGLAGTGPWNLRLRLPLDRQGCEEIADVLDKQAGRFERGAVAAGLGVGPIHDGVGLLGVAADGDVLGEDGHAGRYPGRDRPVSRVHGLVVDVRGRAGGTGEPVHADVGEDLVPGDRVFWQRMAGAGPLLELLDDPG